MSTLAEKHLEVKRIETVIQQFTTGLIWGFDKPIETCLTSLNLIQIQKLNSTSTTWRTSVVWNGLNEVNILGIVSDKIPVKLANIKFLPISTPIQQISTPSISTLNSVNPQNVDLLQKDLEKMVEKVRQFLNECDLIYRIFFQTRPRCKVCSLQVISCDSFCDLCYMYIKTKTNLCLTCLKPKSGKDSLHRSCDLKDVEFFSIFGSSDEFVYQRVGQGLYQVYGTDSSLDPFRPTIYEYKKFIRTVRPPDVKSSPIEQVPERSVKLIDVEQVKQSFEEYKNTHQKPDKDLEWDEHVKEVVAMVRDCGEHVPGAWAEALRDMC